MRVKSPIPMIMAAALAAALAAPAAAQSPGGSSKGPIDITADELEVQNAQCISIWRGNAEALQDQSRLRANVLTAHMAPKGKAAPAGGAGNPGSSCGELQRMEATGAVYYVTPTQRVHGDAATWDATNNMLTVTGDVVAVQGQNVIRGNKMVYNTVTGQGNVVGSGKGPKGQRPRAVFYPKDSDSKSASSTTAKPKSSR
jgi:lipopolysaccharide export system protein LptA